MYSLLRLQRAEAAGTDGIAAGALAVMAPVPVLTVGEGQGRFDQPSATARGHLNGPSRTFVQLTAVVPSTGWANRCRLA